MPPILAPLTKCEHHREQCLALGAERIDDLAAIVRVGASKGFIRGPFLVEGSLSGAFGGLLASGLLALVLRRVVEAMRGANLGATLAPTLGAMDVFALVAIGAFVGLFGSFVSLGRLRD